MTGAGDLFYRVHAQRRKIQSDGYGNERAEWETQFTVSAVYSYKGVRGREEVLAGRLEGVHPVLITVRRHPKTLQITTDWQLIDARDGTVWAVNDVTHETDRQFITLLCRKGIAS